MKGLIEALKKIKEDRMLGSAGAQTIQPFVGDYFTAKFSFVSSTRTFSLRHDPSFNSGYTVTCKPEGEEIDVTVLFRPAEDKIVEAFSAGEVFESGVNFVEFDALYQRAVFTGSLTQSTAGVVSKNEAVTETEKEPDPESHEPLVEAVSDFEPEPEPEQTTQEAVKVPARRQTGITGQRCTLEIDGTVKEFSQESISSVIEELKGAENYWVFKPGSRHSWRREFVSYSRRKLSVNEDEAAKRDHSYWHWKGKTWKEKLIISPEEASDKIKELLEANEFGAERPFKGPSKLGRKVEVDWGPSVEMSSETIDEVVQSLSEANECWVLITGSEKLGYKEFIQYLFDDGNGHGTYEKWRGGAPVQREKISPEEALKKAKNYLKSEEFVVTPYLSHFSGDLKQDPPVKAGIRVRRNKRSSSGIQTSDGLCGCMTVFAIIVMALVVAQQWGPAIIVTFLGVTVGRFMTSNRKS